MSKFDKKEDSWNVMAQQVARKDPWMGLACAVLVRAIRDKQGMVGLSWDLKEYFWSPLFEMTSELMGCDPQMIRDHYRIKIDQYICPVTRTEKEDDLKKISKAIKNGNYDMADEMIGELE